MPQDSTDQKAVSARVDATREFCSLHYRLEEVNADAVELADLWLIEATRDAAAALLDRLNGRLSRAEAA